MKLGWMLLTTSVLVATVGTPSVAHANLFEGPGAINIFLGSGGQPHAVYASHTPTDPAGCYDIADYGGTPLVLSTWCGLTGVAAFGSADGHNHAIVANSTFTILGAYDWTSGAGSVAVSSFAIPTPATYGYATHLSGFQSADLEEHVVMSTTLGYIFDYRWSGSNVTTGTWHELTPASYTGGTVLDVAAFEAYPGIEMVLYARPNYISFLTYENNYSSFQYPFYVSAPNVSAVDAFSTGSSNGTYYFAYATSDSANDVCSFQETAHTGALTTPDCGAEPQPYYDVSGYYSAAGTPAEAYFGSTSSYFYQFNEPGAYGPY